MPQARDEGLGPYLPNGALAFKRLPFLARPRKRVILVLTDVSSMNTSRPGSHRGLALVDTPCAAR